jgi:hypothetical protein
MFLRKKGEQMMKTVNINKFQQMKEHMSAIRIPNSGVSHIENPYTLIDEIIETPLTMEQAFNLEWLDQYEINDIAASLVHRLNSSEQDNRNETYFKHMELRLCFPGNIIDSLIKTGEFLNTHQTGTSCGAGGKERAIVENLFLECPLELFDVKRNELNYIDDERLHYLRPKYVRCNDMNRFNFSDKFTVLQYGNFSAVLENHVKHRSTFTFYDSLTPSDKNKIHTFNHRYEHKSPYESQVYGRISIEQDVKYFLVNPVSLLFEKTALNELKKFNKPLYNGLTGSIIYEPQELVDKPTRNLPS